MARKQKHEEHENLERWLVSYADFMTLLFATVVVLYALAQIDMKEFDELLKKADLLITHGGVGTIVTALKMGKKVIASPRLAQYGEHHNDHQCQIIDSFCEKGYILSCVSVEQMKSAILASKEFTPQPFISNQQAFLNLIRKEINE